MTNAEQTKIISTIRKEVDEGCNFLKDYRKEGNDISIIYGKYNQMFGEIRILHMLGLIDTSDYIELDKKSWNAFMDATEIHIN